MGVSPDTPWVVHSQVKSFIILELTHLIKNLRNNFMDKDIAFKIGSVNMTAKWLYVEIMLYSTDRGYPIQAVSRWTEEHFTLPRGKKIKIMLSCQIFYQSTAAAMRFYVQILRMPSDALQTAQFLETCQCNVGFC